MFRLPPEIRRFFHIIDEKLGLDPKPEETSNRNPPKPFHPKSEETDLSHLTTVRGRRILLASPQDAINEVFRTMYTAAGYEVRTTERALDVVDIVAEFHPDVTLFELIMAGIDGVKLSIRLHELYPNIKIVLCERTEEFYLQYFLDIGIDCEVLSVPAEKEKILRMMNTWASGGSHIDPVTRLRDGEYFKDDIEMARSYTPSAIFLEIVELSPGSPLPDNSFLKALRALLVKIADKDGFAYRCEERKFALLLRFGKEEVRVLAAQLADDCKDLLQNHNLAGTFSIAVASVTFPDDARTEQQALQLANNILHDVEAAAAAPAALCAQAATDEAPVRK